MLINLNKGEPISDGWLDAVLPANKGPDIFYDPLGFSPHAPYCTQTPQRRLHNLPFTYVCLVHVHEHFTSDSPSTSFPTPPQENS